MKLLVFGSTGGTGRELLNQALDQGHSVTAYARDPAKIEDIQHSNLKVVPGDVLDPVAVESVVAGHEAVFVTIGAGPARTTLREEGTRNIIESMQSTGVKRLICQSSLGVGDSRANLPFFTKQIKGWVSRADVADFMLKQLADDTYLHQTPGMSN